MIFCPLLNFLDIMRCIYGSGGLAAKSCPALMTPWTVCSLPGPSVHRILQTRILEWDAASFSRASSEPRN